MLPDYLQWIKRARASNSFTMHLTRSLLQGVNSDFVKKKGKKQKNKKETKDKQYTSCKLLFCESSPYTIYMMTFEYSHFIASLSEESLVSPVEVMGTCAAGGGTWQMAQGHGSPAQCWKPVPTWSGGVGGVFIKV